MLMSTNDAAIRESLDEDVKILSDFEGMIEIDKLEIFITKRMLRGHISPCAYPLRFYQVTVHESCCIYCRMVRGLSTMLMQLIERSVSEELHEGDIGIVKETLNFQCGPSSDFQNTTLLELAVLAP